ncbi:hypothetical protein [Actinocatenispora rupis]|uniref:Excreted virulence factor EspC, type VII ESX diderm n=1 Tax=Actinocatenispora rupis TaxID=519421 RepID=A0A8J3IXP8_9ACTN|nr:hypothetical protein [Actinocatenispora rupis]GID11966.1 hypothetical protein Aru02nite_28550 [Actinocatenispora rupis]
MSDTSVVPDSLRTEATHWNHLAGPLNALATQISATQLHGSAFCVGSVLVDLVAADLATSYERLRSELISSVLKGSTEFDQIAAVLRRIADMYDNNENVNAKSLRDIYGD